MAPLKKNTQVKKDPQVDWRKFPQFEQVFTEEAFEPFLSRMEKTCEALQDVAANGDKSESSRARAALAAYGRALELTQEVLHLRATSPAPSR